MLGDYLRDKLMVVETGKCEIEAGEEEEVKCNSPQWN